MTCNKRDNLHLSSNTNSTGNFQEQNTIHSFNDSNIMCNDYYPMNYIKS